MTEFIDIQYLLPVMEEVLSYGGGFTFFPGGGSMRPMLHGERDSVTVVKPRGRLKKNDIALYLAPNGRYVLHRVIKVLRDSYIMRGDSVMYKEYGITDRDIIAVVSSCTRKGKPLSMNSYGYRVYCNIWRSLPFLRLFLTLPGKKA